MITVLKWYDWFCILCFCLVPFESISTVSLNIILSVKKSILGIFVHFVPCIFLSLSVYLNQCLYLHENLTGHHCWASNNDQFGHCHDYHQFSQSTFLSRSGRRPVEGRHPAAQESHMNSTQKPSNNSGWPPLSHSVAEWCRKGFLRSDYTLVQKFPQWCNAFVFSINVQHIKLVLRPEVLHMYTKNAFKTFNEYRRRR